MGLHYVFAEDVSNPEAREGITIGIEKDLLATRATWCARSEISSQGLGCLRPQRTTTVFSTFCLTD